MSIVSALRRIFVISTCAAPLIVAGCANLPLPVNYAPSSVMSDSGALSVGAFTYLPAESGSNPIPYNVIRNTAIGTIAIDRDVKVFVRDAVFSELRFVGIKTNDPDRILTGEIQEFLIDDFGYSVDWTLRIKYILTDSTNHNVAYCSVKTVARKTAKGLNPFAALNENIKLSVEELLGDQEFIKAIN